LLLVAVVVEVELAAAVEQVGTAHLLVALL
jgi:hypothetical protein